MDAVSTVSAAPDVASISESLAGSQPTFGITAPSGSTGSTLSATPSPVVVWVTATAGLPGPIRPVAVPVITGCGPGASWPAKVTTTLAPGSGPPVQTTFPVPTAMRSLSAACTWALVAFQGMAAVV